MGPVNPTAGSWHEAHDRFRLRERFWSKKIAFPSCSLGDSVPAAHATVNVSMSRPAAPAAMNRLRPRDIVSSVQLRVQPAGRPEDWLSSGPRRTQYSPNVAGS